MASSCDDTPDPGFRVVSLPSDSTLHSTAESSSIFESQVLADSESGNTTPSASPEKSGKMTDFVAENDTTHMQKVEEDASQNDSNIPSGSDASDAENGDGENSDVENSNSTRSGSMAANRHMRRRLRQIGRNWRSRDWFLPRMNPGRPVMTRDQTNVKTLNDHLNMMRWISDIFDDAPYNAPSDFSEDAGRTKCSVGLKALSWGNWLPPPPQPVGMPPAAAPLSGQLAAFAVAYLNEEIPTIFQRNYTPSSVKASQSTRPLGVEHLPSRVRIHSLAIRRFLGRVTDGKLIADGRNVYMSLYRPYKLLVHVEEAIREHLSTLVNLCSEAKKAKEGPDLSSKEGEKGSRIEDPSLNQGSSNEEDLGRTVQDSTETKMYTDIDELDVDAEFPPPTFAGRSDLEDHQLFNGDNWERHSKEELEEAYRDFSALVNFIDKFISPLRKALREVDDMPVHFNELWHLYTPGSMVYVKDPSVPQKLWRVIQGTGGAWSPLQRNTPDAHLDYLRLGGVFGGTRVIPFTLDCYYVDFNGTHFVRVVKKFDIEAFKDPTSIKSLPILPLRVAEKEGLVRTEHIYQRASAFIFFTQFRYCYYRGRSITHEPEGGLLQRPGEGTGGSVAVVSESIESPVVVDFGRCFQAMPNWKPCRTHRELSVPYRDAGSPGPAIDDDRVWDLRMAEKVLNYTDQSQTLEWDSRIPPAGDEMLLLPGRVFAYVLRTRKWACLPLGRGDTDLEESSLTTMESEPSAWDNLQIDYNHRSIIQSMMATHFRKKKSERRQFDLIQDKGKGLIVLLHGVPGVGKTSTAETVAQYYNKPLLPITCGDLGMTPAEVESNLQSSFQLAQAWDCVLLLDEADVFLAERSQDNIARNALVSVFLRVMEYYEGILFLTTNKVGSFDEAFKSRMSLALYYPPLTQDQTEKIWEVQMRRTEKLSKEAAPDDESQQVKFNRLDILALAKELWMMQQSRADWKPVWNGRQIRNAFQTAVALAEWHQQDKNIAGPIDVKREHFEKVAFVSNEFNAYLYTVKHGRTDENLSLRNQHRADQFDRSSQIPWGGLGFAPQQQYPQFQQQQQGLGGWGNLQNSNVMGGGGQGGMTMGIQGLGNNNFQAQTGFGNPLQSGFGAMGNQVTAGAGMASGGLNNTGVGNSGMNNYTIGGQGVNNPAMGNQGMGAQGMSNQAMGTQGVGNQSVGSGMQTCSINPQGMSGQNIPRQMMGQQQ